MNSFTRKEFLRKTFGLMGASALAPFASALMKTKEARADNVADIYVSKNGTPVTNMQKVIEVAGGISNFIGSDDIVILKPNLQWPKQGYTNAESTKALIEIILNRPGGFSGEIIVAENVQGRDVDDTAQCGWSVSPGTPRLNNWADMNFNELISWFQSQGAPNVTAAKLINSEYPWVSGPAEGKGYVSVEYVIQNSPGANGRGCHLPYPIIESSYSGKLIDTKHGIWSGGGYTGQKAKLIFLPTLNLHSNYAGCTSAVKSHLGIVKMDGGDNSYSLHRVGYNTNPGVVPSAVGEAVGELIVNILQPTLYITIAEWSGNRGRTDNSATNTKTVGLCRDPVSLDYWMGKYVIGPYSATCDPSNDNSFRQTLEGCMSKGVGTLNESEMAVWIHDHENPNAGRLDIDRRIKLMKQGAATESDVTRLIEEYTRGN